MSSRSRTEANCSSGAIRSRPVCKTICNVLVERFFDQLKHFRAIATRYDKLARIFLAGVQLAATMILLN